MHSAYRLQILLNNSIISFSNVVYLLHAYALNHEVLNTFSRNSTIIKIMLQFNIQQFALHQNNAPAKLETLLSQ